MIPHPRLFKRRTTASITILALCTIPLLAHVFAKAKTNGSLALASTNISPNAPLNEGPALNTSNLFGGPVSGELNQAGDYAFVAGGATALFLRRAGTSTLVRVLQTGEAVPGIPGSSVNQIGSLRLNNSGKLAFTVFPHTIDGSVGQTAQLDFGQRALMLYDGVTLRKIVASRDIAPGTGGAIYGRQILLGGINDTGDVAFTGSGPSPITLDFTLFIAPLGGNPVRIAGPGDAAPGTGGTFSSISFASGVTSLNNTGEVVFSSQIVGGSGGFGLFVGSTAGVRKVVAKGDSIPGGGTFSSSVQFGLVNNAGQVAFDAINAQGNDTLWVHTAGSGIAKVVSVGDSAPAALGGSFSTLGLSAFNDNGAIIFTADISGSAVAPRGLFRFVPGSPGGIQTIASANQAVPAASPATFSTFSSVSMNGAGLVSFRATLVGGSIARGIFQQSGASAPVKLALEGDTVDTLAGGGSTNFFNSTITKTLNNGSTYCFADVIGGNADYAELLGTPGSAATILMNDGDTLPPGSRTSQQTLRVKAAGDYMAFAARQAGGRSSIIVRNITTGVSSTIMTEGDVAPGTGGGRLRGFSTAFVNSSGTVALKSNIIGGTQGISSGIFTANTSGGLAKLVADGDTDPNSGSTFSQTTPNLISPSPLTATGLVVFKATVLGRAGIYVSSGGGAIQRIAQAADAAPGGGTFAAFSGSPSINQGGQVAFFATTTGGTGQNQGIFLGTPGAGVSKVAVSGDSVTGGGTFFSFPGSIALNDSGEIAFIASFSPNGTTGGAFAGPVSGPLQSIAIDGAATPAGGSFFFVGTNTPNRHTSVDILLNNEHDIAFRSGLTGGSGDSAYFLRRGATGPLQAVAVQGQAAPGTAGTFATMDATINDAPGEFFALGPTGELAFLTEFQTSTGPIFGSFRFRLDNVLERILAHGDVVPGTGNGVLVAASQGIGTGGPGHFGFWAAIIGGNVDDIIYVTSSPAGFGISGQVKDASGVGIAGVTVTLSDSSSGTTTTDSKGSYSFANLQTGGNYTVTPSNPTFAFTPASQTFNNLSVDRVANFVGTRTIVSITGKVVDANNIGISNVTLALTKNGAAAGPTQTNASGDYSFGNLQAGAIYVVKPTGTVSAPNFAPSSETFNNLTVNATANFKAAPAVPPQCNTPSFAAANNFSVGAFPFSLALTDFNGDAKLDMAVANYNSANVSILLGTGTGSFSAPTNFAVGTNPQFVAMGDFNGDGKLDLATANNTAANVSILLGTGTGSFSAATNFAVGINPESVAVGDFNGDGKLDLAVANGSSNSVSILLGTGTGSFSAATNFAVGTNPRSVTVGDFNGDGKLDLAVANRTSNNISILLGTGTGSFSTATNFAVGTSPRFVAVGDINGDGKLDLAVPNFQSDSVSILLGTGTGSFSAATNFAVGSSPNYDGLADFNGDGKLDLAVANFGSNNVSILLGTGTGSFGAATNFVVGTNPASVAVGDFNGDSKLDLAVANSGSANVSVLLNNGTLCNTQSSLTISGQITDASNKPLPNVTVTLSGPDTRVVQSDVNGNYLFPNLTPGGDYAVTVQSPYFVLVPSRADFFNLSSSQTFNFQAAQVVVPPPTPPLSDDFGGVTRDTTKWNLGTETLPAGSFDPQVTTTQVNGQLVIAPLTQAVGMHYDGYVSVNSFDLRGGTAGVELVKAATGGADSIFSVGSDANNFMRFLVHTPGAPTSLATSKGPDGLERPFDSTTPQLLFQVNIAGHLETLPITYDPVQHRFMRFFIDAAANTVKFQTSPDDVVYTTQLEKVLGLSVSALTAELTAGTSSPTNPGLTIFDNLKVITSTFQFNATGYSVNESDGSVQITVTRSGLTTNAARVDFGTMDGTAHQTNKYIATAGTLSFAAGEMSKTFSVLVENNPLPEGNETVNLLLSNPVGSGLNSPGRSVLTIVDNSTTVPTTNALDDSRFFVTQQYLDFLNRQPDASGVNFWTNNIESCGTNASCREAQRINTSAAFFLSIEFQQTGYLVERIYKAAYGDANGASTFGGAHQLGVPIVRFNEFLPDTQRIGQGVIVGQSGWETVLENNKQAFTTEFVQRSRFSSAYATSLTPTAFVNQLFLNAGVTPSTTDRNAAIAEFGSATNTSDAAARGRALRRVAENSILSTQEFNRAFVLMQFFGYLRRNPNDPQDTDYTGYDFWLTKLNQFNGNFVSAEMVKAFINSVEYRQRFGP